MLPTGFGERPNSIVRLVSATGYDLIRLRQLFVSMGRRTRAQLEHDSWPNQVELPAPRSGDIDPVGIDLAGLGAGRYRLMNSWRRGTERMTIDNELRTIPRRSRYPEDLVVRVLRMPGTQRIAEDEPRGQARVSYRIGQVRWIVVAAGSIQPGRNTTPIKGRRPATARDAARTCGWRPKL